jgi:hypothetical protein
MRKPKKRSRKRFEHKRKVAEKRRARAFWKMREQYRRETERGFAPPPVPKWMSCGYMALAGGLAGFVIYFVGKFFVNS